MKNSLFALALSLALFGCEKDKAKPADVAKPDVTAKPGDETKPAGDTKLAEDTKPADPVKPVDPPPPADPTAGWTEHKGAGFTVKGARAPQEQSQMTETDYGPQPVTFYVGYEPDGFEGSFQTAVTDIGATVKEKLDPKKVVDDSITGMMSTAGATITSDEPTTNGDGRRIVASGNHPQGGPFTIHGRVYLKDGKMYMVQALSVKASDAPMAAAFVDSFQFTP